MSDKKNVKRHILLSLIFILLNADMKTVQTNDAKCSNHDPHQSRTQSPQAFWSAGGRQEPEVSGYEIGPSFKNL